MFRIHRGKPRDNAGSRPRRAVDLKNSARKLNPFAHQGKSEMLFLINGGHRESFTIILYLKPNVVSFSTERDVNA